MEVTPTVTWTMIPAYAYLAALSLSLAFIDIRSRRLPNALTLSGYPIMIALLIIPAAVDDRWSSLARAIAGSLVTLGTFTAMALLASGSFGMGDAKLAGVLALPLTWTSWSHTVLAMAGSFILSAVVSVALLISRRATRRSLIPFGPFLIAATWIVTAFG